MFKIGEFSRLSRVSVRMLRHYDRLGLLTPSQTDSLTKEQIKRLNESSPIDLGFPHSFLGSDHVHGLIFGKMFEQIVK